MILFHQLLWVFLAKVPTQSLDDACIFFKIGILITIKCLWSLSLLCVGLQYTVYTMAVACQRLRASMHTVNVSWLHFTCLPLNTTSFSSCTSLQVTDSYQKNIFPSGSRSAAANQDICSADLSSADTVLMAFSLIYTIWERAGDSAPARFGLCGWQGRDAICWVRDGGLLCPSRIVLYGACCTVQYGGEEWKPLPKACADYLLRILLFLFSSMCQLPDLTHRFPFDVENCLLNNTTPSFTSWLSARLPTPLF